MRIMPSSIAKTARSANSTALLMLMPTMTRSLSIFSPALVLTTKPLDSQRDIRHIYKISCKTNVLQKFRIPETEFRITKTEGEVCRYVLL